MKLVKPVPQHGPENQKGEPRRVCGQAHTIKVFAPCPNERDTAPRLLGRIKIRPGPVAPGHLAAVRTRDGLLQFGRIYYEHAGKGEPGYVCLRALRPGAEDLRRRLSEVRIEGAVVGVYRLGERCAAVKT